MEQIYSHIAEKSAVVTDAAADGNRSIVPSSHGLVVTDVVVAVCDHVQAVLMRTKHEVYLMRGLCGLGPG